MYLINRENNTIEQLEQKSFSELGFREREHLQEWISKNPACLGEELLVIQKEFSGFDETNERLDLLALDKQGELVIIENKLDDSGRDVTWQSLKYASYCSNLSKENIRKIFQDYLDKTGNGNAEEKLSEFFENLEYEDLVLNKGFSQRLILIAANFRKEVTSTVLWLLNYKLKIQCFKATPHALEGQLFLSMEQIIPIKDAEDYMVGMGEKVREDIGSQNELKHRHYIRKEFFTQLLHSMNLKSDLFQNISPSIYNWIGAGSGVRGVGFNFSISKKHGRAEVYIDRGEQKENKLIFDTLFGMKEIIETDFGEPLEWERLEDKRASRIKSEMPNNVFEKENWDEMVEFMIDRMTRMEKAMKAPLQKVNALLKKTNHSE